MDTFLLRTVCEELCTTLVGARLENIQQASEQQFLFVFRRQRQTHYLLISLDPSFPRVHLIREKGAAEPAGNFCALLKSRLSGATLTGLEQEGMERVLFVHFSRRDELGRLSHPTLVAELIPRAQNLIVIDEAGTILASHKRITPSINRPRTVERGAQYSPPLKQKKADPLSATEKEIMAITSNQKEGEHLWQLLTGRFHGLSPLMAMEIEVRALNRRQQLRPNAEAIWEEFCTVMDFYREMRFSPTVYLDEEGLQPMAVAPFPLALYRGRKAIPFDSPSQALQFYYDEVSKGQYESRRLRELSQLTVRRIKKLHDRKKAVLSDLQEASRAEEFRLKGDLILANLNSIKKGMESIILSNILQEKPEELRVELDPSLEATSNARNYFKRYSKLKTKFSVAQGRLRETEAEIAQWEELLSRLKGGEDAEAVAEQLMESGFLWEDMQSGSRKPKQAGKAKGIVKHTAPEGWVILVGKNSRANDYLTTLIARRDDLWLHARGTCGAHVIIRNPSRKKGIPQSIVQRAAILAATNSKNRGASTVSVEYAFRKHVRKPKGAPQGTVTVKNFKTVTVSLKDVNDSET